jgi:ankyrin repeat protein
LEIKPVAIVIISLLIVFIIIKVHFEIYRAAFFKAVRNGDQRSLAKLLEKGINVNIRSKYFGWTGLMYAAFFGHIDCVRLLLQKGAQVNKRSKNNWRLMFMGHTEMASYGIRYEKGRTALMNAVMRRRPAIVKLLLENGAEVNARTSSGWTALMAAASKDDADTVKMLIDSGADSEIRDNDFGMTALEIAKSKKYENVVCLLQASAAGKRSDDS